ncbi:MAG: glycoside hydrolase family 30 protein [Cyclobacteriaceae bacterium]
MNKIKLPLFIYFLLLVWSCTSLKQDQKNNAGEISVWITTGDKTSLLANVSTKLAFDSKPDTISIIEVDTTQHFQTVDGFGFALTGGSAYLINQKLSATAREELLKELFLTDGNRIGVSYLRVSIGASDLDDHVFSYDDLPANKTDVLLNHFSFAEDQKNLIPVLKQIVKLNPEIKIMGSPWSAPAWMKDNANPKGGHLKPEYYDAYAKYFVKYIQGMAAEGIVIDAITLQNEPENPKNNPSMLMTAEEQALFVKKHLGPIFREAKIKTKIVVFDHNCDNPNYPITILNDANAKKFVDGSAFHLYLGNITALSEVHESHPDRNIYFTEQWTWSQGNFDGDLRWHTKNLIVGATRNWSRNVLEWNLAADQNQNPHTDQGGCTECLGALTINDSVSRNVSYYIIAHASKFVRPGSVRVASNIIEGLPNVAFVTPKGQKVLIVLNDTDQEKGFSIKFKEKTAPTVLAAGAVGTYVW